MKFLFAVLLAIGFCFAGSASANDNVRILVRDNHCNHGQADVVFINGQFVRVQNVHDQVVVVNRRNVVNRQRVVVRNRGGAGVRVNAFPVRVNVGR